MRVICSFKLVLNKHPRVIVSISTKNISAEWANGFFLCLKLQIHRERFGESGDVFFARQPWREMLGFCLPDFSKIHAVKFAKYRHHTTLVCTYSDSVKLIG